MQPKLESGCSTLNIECNHTGNWGHFLFVERMKGGRVLAPVVSRPWGYDRACSTAAAAHASAPSPPLTPRCAVLEHAHRPSPHARRTADGAAERRAHHLLSAWATRAAVATRHEDARRLGVHAHGALIDKRCLRRRRSYRRRGDRRRICHLQSRCNGGRGSRLNGTGHGGGRGDGCGAGLTSWRRRLLAAAASATAATATAC